jgi:hypothetical protein
MRADCPVCPTLTDAQLAQIMSRLDEQQTQTPTAPQLFTAELAAG